MIGEVRSEHITNKQQEPKITAFVSQDPRMIDAFQHDRDIYATIASLAFNVSYEKCLEFHPETHEYQPDGKARRSEAKTILLGLTYGRSVPSISEQLYGTRDDMTDEEKVKGAQKVYDSVLNAFPDLRKAMLAAQNSARRRGYTETILGRRRHLPDMQLPEFEFSAKRGYVNPDVDPLNPETLKNTSDIPERIVKQLQAEFKEYKYFGQIARRIRELDEQHIKVVNNRPKINDATRQCLNCVDKETEILTTSGWKTYKEIKVGDEILSFNLDSCVVTRDTIQAVHVYEGSSEVIEFKSPTFSAVSTPNHRWVCNDSTSNMFRFITSEHIERNKWPDYPILRVWDNNIESSCNWSDDQLKLFGWIMTDGSISNQWYGIEIFQTTRTEKNRYVYQSMIDVLDRLEYSYSDRCSDGFYHVLYLHKNDWLYDIFVKYQNSRELDFDFVSKLNQHQSEVLMWSMIEGDGTLGDNSSNITYTCSSKYKADVFQYLAFVAGYATSCYEVPPEIHNSWNSSDISYDSIGYPIKPTKPYYSVTVYRIRRAQIYPNHKSRKFVDMVWCVTTGNGTWVARRDNKVYITGNSVIQGSAADMTKLAILRLENNPEWKAIGGRLLVPVHDELVCEVPMDHYKEGMKLLEESMVGAADFLPFPIKCDVTATLRWYGLEYPCKYPKPASLENLNSDEIKWIQYHLYECEYELPVFKDENGEKPRGDAALGVNGIDSSEFRSYISDYMHRYKLSTDVEFLSHIDKKVIMGTI